MQNRRGGDSTVEATIDAELQPPDARAAERDEKVAKLLGEADVYIKYGIRDRAIAHLGKVLELDAENLDAHERLKDVYLALGRTPEATLELVRLVELAAFAGGDQVDAYLAELAALDPESAEALARRIGRSASAEEFAVVPASFDARPVSIDSVDVVIEPPSVDVAARVLGRDPDGEGTEVRDEFAQATTAGDGTVELDDAETDALEVADDQVESEEESHPELAFDEMVSTAAGGDKTYDISVEAPSIDSLEARSLEEAEGLVGASDLPPQEYAIDPGDDAIEESIGVELEPDEAKAGGGSLEDDLDEVDFFVTQGLVEEARTILRDLLARHPNHPLIGAKLNALDGRAGLVVPPTERPLSAPSPIAPPPVAEPPRRVIAKPLGETDADTHYDLGLAYKEMGLIEEAMKEFSLVRDTPAHAVQCHLMIGLCHIERGKLQEAVDEFKNGLYVDGINDREALALYFELGAAYEGLGDAREAIYYFEKVQKREARFRDVGRRIEGLRSAAALNGGRGGRDSGRGESSDEEMSALDSLGEHEV